MTVKEHSHRWVPFGVAGSTGVFVENAGLDLQSVEVVFVCNDRDCTAWTDQSLPAQHYVETVDVPLSIDTIRAASEHRLAGAEPAEQPADPPWKDDPGINQHLLDTRPGGAGAYTQEEWDDMTDDEKAQAWRDFYEQERDNLADDDS